MASKSASSSAVALAALREALIAEGHEASVIDVLLYAIGKKVSDG